MDKSCYGCRFALEGRNHVREGEQVRCGKAEQLFGGERWVTVRKSKRGHYLKSKCGRFEAFQGDDSTAPDLQRLKKKSKKRCRKCQGSGKLTVTFVNGPESMKCHNCKGAGSL
ncbi:hypothetical protein BpsS36_00043 [Bacillus phage vB_BpsS-36]|uniref:Uncharacterized protein n=1 Tax=Bacillus phage vB_BpsS-36 TaxID=2419622 RepID=A0A3G3BWT7_9CAUD|nr:hypothetical protein BpsS36_00043 [Bacillus phage vB_BpsS-36]